MHRCDSWLRNSRPNKEIGSIDRLSSHICQVDCVPHSGQGSIPEVTPCRSYPHTWHWPRLILRFARTDRPMAIQQGTPATVISSQSGTANTRADEPPPVVSNQPKSPNRHSSQREICHLSSHARIRVGSEGCQSSVDSLLGLPAADEPAGITARNQFASDSSIRPLQITQTRACVCSSIMPEPGGVTHVSSVRPQPKCRQKLATQTTSSVDVKTIDTTVIRLRFFLFANITDSRGGRYSSTKSRFRFRLAKYPVSSLSNHNCLSDVASVTPLQLLLQPIEIHVEHRRGVESYDL